MISVDKTLLWTLNLLMSSPEKMSNLAEVIAGLESESLTSFQIKGQLKDSSATFHMLLLQQITKATCHMDTVTTFQYNASALLIHARAMHRMNHAVKACFLTQTCRTVQTSRVDPWEHTIVPRLANRKFYDGATAWWQDEDRLRGVNCSWSPVVIKATTLCCRTQDSVYGPRMNGGECQREEAPELQHCTKRCWEKKVYRCFLLEEAQTRLTILKPISGLNSLFSFYFSKATLKVRVQND